MADAACTCGEADVRFLGDLDREPADEIVYRCFSCGRWWTGETMPPMVVSSPDQDAADA